MNRRPEETIHGARSRRTPWKEERMHVGCPLVTTENL